MKISATRRQHMSRNFYKRIFSKMLISFCNKIDFYIPIWKYYKDCKFTYFYSRNSTKVCKKEKKMTQQSFEKG